MNRIFNYGRKQESNLKQKTLIHFDFATFILQWRLRYQLKVKGKGSKQCSQQATALQDSCKENQDGVLKAKRIDPLRPRDKLVIKLTLEHL